MFVHAAERLGVAPGDSVVVEDAISGVASGRAGDFALVIGVDRGGNRDALVAAGADIVVDDLEETLP
jgi:beta-phosphoglucomutase-like phosphatase (HAD superfamily)